MMPCPPKQQSSLMNYFQDSRKRPRPTSSCGIDSSNHLKRTGTGSRFGSCPLCGLSLPWHNLEIHAATCKESEVEPRENTTSSMVNPKSTKLVVPIVTASTAATTQQDQLCHISELPNNNNNKTITDVKSVQVCTTNQLDLRLVSPETNQDVPKSNCSTSLDMLFLSQKKHSSTVQHPEKLFGSPLQDLPSGLFIYPDFITMDEEQQLLSFLDDPNLEPSWKMGRFNGQHAGKRWGVHCNLRDRRVDAPEYPLPSLLQSIVFSKLSNLPCWNQLVTQRPNFRQFRPNEANAIDYRRHRGDWLQPHVDDRKLSTEPIANLSLAGDCVMTFGGTRTRTNRIQVRIHLQQRGLQILTGPARYNYTHEIANRDLLSPRRVSITMRESPLTHGKTTAEIATLTLPKIDTIFPIQRPNSVKKK